MAFDSERKLLNSILTKLVLDPSEKLMKKSYEYLSLLKIKKGAGLVNLSDSCAVVICVNLACETLCSSFDKAQAIKVAGVTKKHYANFYHTIEKMLGLDKPTTVTELCVKLSCSEVSDLAQRLIQRYSQDEKQVKGMSVDFSLPMYSCAAVLAACKHRKLRVKRELLVETSRIKAKDLDKLAFEFLTYADQTDKKASRKRGHRLIDLVEQMVKDSQKTTDVEDRDEEEDNKPKESFEDWKRRMLARP